MNIVKTGTMYRIFDKSVEVISDLKPLAYQVSFMQGEGLLLTEVSMPSLRDEKVYGDHGRKLDKVFSSYKAQEDRNLGVILSGAKGIGKTLFAKMACERATREGMPVIFVNSYFNGLGPFFSKVTQDVMVVFDEFDKNFYSNDSDDVDRTACQDQLLTLFDGVYGGHKLFVVTCNSLNRLSDFYVNRPGRFRYHIRFDYPKQDEVRQYLADRLGEKAKEYDVDSVCKFSSMVPLSYDCLSAIADELAQGETFKSAMEMLNIIRVNSDEAYSVYLKYRVDGCPSERMCLVSNSEFIDLFEPSDNDNLKSYRLFPHTVNSEGHNVRVYAGSVDFSVEDLRKNGVFGEDGRLALDAKFCSFRPPNAEDGNDSVLREFVKGLEFTGVELVHRHHLNENVSYCGSIL